LGYIFSPPRIIMSLMLTRSVRHKSGSRQDICSAKEAGNISSDTRLRNNAGQATQKKSDKKEQRPTKRNRKLRVSHIPTNDAAIAVSVDHREITGPHKPVWGNHFCRLIRLVPVGDTQITALTMFNKA